MNIEKFIARRKELGYSQSELARGICTQATISKFENGGKMISTKILTQLCQRLNLSLSDIFPGPVDHDSKMFEKLARAEFDLITMEYDEALGILDGLSLEEMGNDDTKMEYLFIKGYLLALNNQPSDAAFCFDQILDGYDETHQTIYSQLAYVGLGLSFEQQEKFDRAEFYFAKMPARLKTITTNDVETTWKSLTMLFYTGDYYSKRGETATGTMLLESLVDLSAAQQVAFYVARAKFRLAQNYSRQGADSQQIQDAVDEAYVFAKFNGNQKLIARINEYRLKN